MFISACVLIFGLMIGSFLNVVIYRLPADESIVWPGSRCPKCGTALTALENIPVLSWVFLGGKCRTCQVPISWRYPANELATALLFLFVYQQFGLSWQMGFLFVLMALLIVTFWIDIDHMLILDVITIPGAILGLVYSALITHQFWYALAAVLYGTALLLAINSLAWFFIGRDGIGGGDFTLVAMLGAWLGLSGTLLGLGLAMVAGAAMGLAIMFARWLKARHWQPFALAVGLAIPVYLGGCTMMGLAAGRLSMPELLLGTWMPAGMQAGIAGFGALIGASAGWLYMRTVKDEGYLEMPFGPALVLGGLLSLFWGAPMIDWYVGRLGPF